MGASLSFSVQKVHCSLKMYRLLLLNGLILMWVVLSAALPTNPYSSQLRSKVPRLVAEWAEVKESLRNTWTLTVSPEKEAYPISSSSHRKDDVGKLFEEEIKPS